MKQVITFATTGFLALASIAVAQDTTFMNGTVKSIDAEDSKVTIIHEELVNLDTPAMMMVFRADEEKLASLSEAQENEFVADRVEGRLTVVKLK